MSFFLNSLDLRSQKILDPEIGLPASMLTFTAPEGPLCIITTSLPTISTRTRQRILKAYASAAAKTNAATILIGGACTDAVLFVESQIGQLDIEFELFANVNLLLLAHSSDRTSAQCIPLDTEAPFSFIACVNATKNRFDEGSAERFAPDSSSAAQPATLLEQVKQLGYYPNLGWAQYHYTQGRSLATRIKDGTLLFHNLDSDEQWMVEAFDSRLSARTLEF